MYIMTACLLISVSEHKINMHIIHSHGGVDWNFHILHEALILSVGQRWVYTATYITFFKHAKLTALLKSLAFPLRSILASCGGW